MKIYYYKHLPSKFFSTINLFGILIAREEAKPLTDELIRHEKIHATQMREMLYIPYYIWYAGEWLIRVIQYRNIYAAYFNMSFEREAYNNDRDGEYLKDRKRYSFL